MSGGEVAGFPAKGLTAEELLADVDERRTGDVDWRGGRSFSLVYGVDEPGLEEVLHAVAIRFLHENALNPFAYRSLPELEKEIIAMAADLLHGDPEAGSLTSGGTESIFLAVQVARDRAREQGIEDPQLVTGETVHPAFAKAAKYLDVEHLRVPIRDDLRVDPDAVRAAMTDRTGLVVASAPCYPFGVIDPVAEIADIAAERDVLCHVDACLGGWLLPFWERIGEPVPPWDLSVPGVTSLSADVHKYGYTYKGASILLHQSRDLLSHQFFLYDDWPGGLYGSATTAGTRPGAPIAGAWAAIRYLGEEGYLRLARVVRDTTRRFQEGIEALPGLRIRGEPDMSVFEFGSDRDDIGAIGDVMDDRGWGLDRQQGGLHVMVFPAHAAVVDEFLGDLADAVETHGESKGVDAVYGAVPD